MKNENQRNQRSPLLYYYYENNGTFSGTQMNKEEEISCMFLHAYMDLEVNSGYVRKQLLNKHLPTLSP